MTLERAWRLLPSETVLWHGRPVQSAARDPLWWLAAAQKTPSALEARTVVLNDTAPELACTGALLIRPDGVVGAHVPLADAKSLRECIDALIEPLNPSPHLQSAELSTRRNHR